MADETEVQVVRNVRDAEVQRIVAGNLIDLNYVAHKVVPLGNGMNDIKFTVSK